MSSLKQEKITRTNWRTGEKTTGRDGGRKTSSSSPSKRDEGRKASLSSLSKRNEGQRAESSSPPKRGGLEGLFPGLEISSGPSHTPCSSETPGNGTLARLVGGYPNWCSFKRSSNEGQTPLNFSFRLKDIVVAYSKDSEVVATFDETFNEVVKLRKFIRDNSVRLGNKLDETIKEEMCLVVFGSNLIERAGVKGFNETRKICLEIFADKRCVFSNIEPRSTEYERELQAAIGAGSAKCRRDRQEVANDAAALVYVINTMVRDNVPLSEDIIKKVHYILCKNVDRENGDTTQPWEDYAGRYRSKDGRDNVCAGNTGFVRPKMVACAMERFVQHINDLIRAAEKSREFDPFYIAAEACGEFVNIHPFMDGNGRTCRLLLNAILVRYTGNLAPLGESEEERREYLAIARRRSEYEDGNGELAVYTFKKVKERLQAVKNKSMGSPKK